MIELRIYKSGHPISLICSLSLFLLNEPEKVNIFISKHLKNIKAYYFCCC